MEGHGEDRVAAQVHLCALVTAVQGVPWAPWLPGGAGPGWLGSTGLGAQRPSPCSSLQLQRRWPPGTLLASCSFLGLVSVILPKGRRCRVFGVTDLEVGACDKHLHQGSIDTDIPKLARY